MKRKVIVSLECELEGDSEEMLDVLMFALAKDRNYAPYREIGGAGRLGGVWGYHKVTTGRVVEVKLADEKPSEKAETKP